MATYASRWPARKKSSARSRVATSAHVPGDTSSAPRTAFSASRSFGRSSVIPQPPNKLLLALPERWSVLGVLAFIGALILGLAACRAVLNYCYTLLLNRLTQQEIVVHLRDQVYSKLQRLSFRFFDANTTGSIITRVTGDVQSVRMFVDQVLIQSVIMVISLTAYIIYMASLSPALTLACLLLSGPLMRLMGHRMEAMLTRLLGVILAALAVQFVLDGLHRSFTA